MRLAETVSGGAGRAAQPANPELVRALTVREPARIEAELKHSTLLVPATPLEGEHALARTARGADGRQLAWAFTDAEALAAFDREPAATAIAISGQDLARGFELIALNPAGPASALLYPGLANLMADAAGAALPLTEPEERAPLRRRAREAHARAREAVAASRLDLALTELDAAAAACAALGDRLHGAAATVELAVCHARAGHVELALPLWERGADALARLGQPHLAIAALLDGAEAAIAAEAHADAQRCCAAVLSLCAGPALADRFVSLWSELDAD